MGAAKYAAVLLVIVSVVLLSQLIGYYSAPTVLKVVREKLFRTHRTRVTAPAAGDESVANQLKKTVRLLCIVPTTLQRLHSRASAVRDTWASRCNRAIFLSSVPDVTFPAISLGDYEGAQKLTTKMTEAFKYIHDHHLSDADWFLKADDDTYVIVENLRYLLSHFDPKQPLYLGHHYQKYTPQGYMSGGAGYVLSREAVRRLVVDGLRPARPQCRRWGGAEDVAIAKCLEAVGVKTARSVDDSGRQTFHPFNLATHLSGPYPQWYYTYSKYTVKKGANCCSDHSISFHFVDPVTMKVMHHLIYGTQVYGLRQGVPASNPFNLTASLERARLANATRGRGGS